MKPTGFHICGAQSHSLIHAPSKTSRGTVPKAVYTRCENNVYLNGWLCLATSFQFVAGDRDAHRTEKIGNVGLLDLFPAGNC